MAEAFLAAGYAVCGYDPVTAAAQRLKRAGGEPLASATEVAEQRRYSDHVARFRHRAR